MRNFRKIIVVAVTVLILLGVTVVPAYAWNFKNIFGSSSAGMDQEDKLIEIEEQIGELSENTKLMKFINLNMHDQSVEVIVIDITEDDKILDSYCIYRGEIGSTADISSCPKDDLSNSWTFRPTIKETQKRLKILESKSLSVGMVLKCLFLWRSVEKAEDVPSIYEIIDKSSWIEEFLPKLWK